MPTRRLALVLACVVAAGCDALSSDPELPPVEGKRVDPVVSAGSRHTCRLFPDGSMSCWGWTMYYGMALGEEQIVRVPTKLPDPTGVVEIAAGSHHTCARLQDGTVKCWGYAESGQLGDGSSVNVQKTPVTVRDLTGAISISAGDLHTCAVVSDNTVRCWGSNSDGQLGADGARRQAVPVAVPGLTGVAQVVAGKERFTCARMLDGTAKCWGFDNWLRRLGGEPMPQSKVPVTVNGLSGAVHLSASAKRVCAVLQDGSASCWGDLDGGAQNGSPVMRVEGIDHVVDIAVGEAVACAVRSDGTVWCWGGNDRGALGNGAPVEGEGSFASRPVQASGISNAAQVTVGEGHVCAWLRDGSLRCWGDNWYTQIGDGTKVPYRDAPVVVE